MTLVWALLIACVLVRPLRRRFLAWWPVTIPAVVGWLVGIALANWAEDQGITRGWPFPFSLQLAWGLIVAFALGQLGFQTLGFLIRPPRDDPQEDRHGDADRR